jgi:hypothetical protein
MCRLESRLTLDAMLLHLPDLKLAFCEIKTRLCKTYRTAE